MRKIGRDSHSSIYRRGGVSPPENPICHGGVSPPENSNRYGREAKRLPYKSPSIKSWGLQGVCGKLGRKRTMMYRLWRYDVFRFAQNDVARFTRNDAMFASMCPQAHIIRRSRHHWHSLHHLPKANIIEKRPSRNSTWSFFWLGY